MTFLAGAFLSYLCVFWLAKLAGRVKDDFHRKSLLSILLSVPLMLFAAIFLSSKNGIVLILLIALIPYWLLWCIAAFAGYRLKRN